MVFTTGNTLRAFIENINGWLTATATDIWPNTSAEMLVVLFIYTLKILGHIQCTLVE